MPHIFTPRPNQTSLNLHLFPWSFTYTMRPNNSLSPMFRSFHTPSKPNKPNSSPINLVPPVLRSSKPHNSFAFVFPTSASLSLPVLAAGYSLPSPPGSLSRDGCLMKGFAGAWWQGGGWRVEGTIDGVKDVWAWWDRRGDGNIVSGEGEFALRRSSKDAIICCSFSIWCSFDRAKVEVLIVCELCVLTEFFIY